MRVCLKTQRDAVIERKALIFNVQKYNMYDGPGLRTLVFFKGCPLRCEWCSNPEGQLRAFQVMLRITACVHCGACVPVCPQGIHSISPITKQHEIDHSKECIGCRKCEAICPAQALAIAGEEKSISELMEIIEQDRMFYEFSGGGVTLSGGEAMMQPESVANLFLACRQAGINTAMETCGYARPEVVAKVAEVTDLFLFDVKHMDSERHLQGTGVRNESILENLRWLLDNRHNVKVRIPLLKSFNDGEAENLALRRFLEPYSGFRNFQGVDILPYHKMGVNKYTQLQWDYPQKGEPGLSQEDLDRVVSYYDGVGYPVNVIKH